MAVDRECTWSSQPPCCSTSTCQGLAQMAMVAGHVRLSLSKYFGTHFRGLMGLKDHAAKPIKAQQHKKTRVHRSCWCCERIRDCTRYSDWKCMSNGKRFHTRLNGCDTFCSELTQCNDTLPVYGKVQPWERSSFVNCTNIWLQPSICNYCAGN